MPVIASTIVNESLLIEQYHGHLE